MESSLGVLSQAEASFFWPESSAARGNCATAPYAHVDAPIDIYAALGVSRRATADRIRQAYYARARDYHPDRNPSAATEEIFKILTRGAEILRNPRTRKLYDLGHIDAAGKLTAKGAGSHRRASLGRTFGAYFIGPFAAGAAVICALLWSEAARLPATASSPLAMARSGAQPSPAGFERIAFTRAFPAGVSARNASRTGARLLAKPRLVRDVSQASDLSHRIRERPAKGRLSDAGASARPTVVALAREAE